MGFRRTMNKIEVEQGLVAPVSPALPVIFMLIVYSNFVVLIGFD
jgi:hypothetical protein